ncbi:MAG: twin-arginine translocase TatA/TatE family subunit [Acidimicrobiia bacterium]|nr:twin-arginine translocase TatA/TatE family subunit [Acidimicrobiia bacterium]
MQGGEVLIILLVALVVLGPTRLPELARKAGRYTSELRKAAREISAGLEAEVADLKSVGEEVKRPFGELRREVDEVTASRLDWTGPKPLSGPTPADAMRDLDEIERRGGASEDSESEE